MPDVHRHAESVIVPIPRNKINLIDTNMTLGKISTEEYKSSACKIPAKGTLAY